MDKQQLHNTLDQLHRELSQGQKLDEDSRQRLMELLGDIQSVLAAEESETETVAPEEHESVRGRLNDAIVDFEAAHPQFSQLMGRIADGLSQLGI